LTKPNADRRLFNVACLPALRQSSQMTMDTQDPAPAQGADFPVPAQGADLADPNAAAPPAARCGFVAVVGRPNVGKSTLVNALVGEKVAIVSPRPQTTRRRILGIRTEGGVQAIFVDTPGIHAPRHGLGRAMVRAAEAAIPDADLVVWVVDAGRPPAALDRRVANLAGRAGRPVLIAMNKSDRLAPEAILERTAAFRALVAAEDWTLTIATTGHNLDRLWAMIAARLPAGPMFYPADQLTDQTDRMLVAELIREAALECLADEVPHGIEVVLEEWARRPDGLLRVAAKVFVERESHKPIVIGRGGAMLKRIGTKARHRIDALLDSRVFLALFVSVRPGWRDNPADIRRLGMRG